MGTLEFAAAATDDVAKPVDPSKEQFMACRTLLFAIMMLVAIVSGADEIFADGFETGDFARWSSATDYYPMLCMAYTDSMLGWWDTSALESLAVPGYVSQPYSVIAMSYWLSTGTAVDSLALWTNLSSYLDGATQEVLTGSSSSTDEQLRSAIRELDRSAGLTRLVTAFGETDQPIAGGLDPTALATSLAAFIVSNQLDGVLVDWEESSYLDSSGTGEAWLSTFTTVLHAQLEAAGGQSYIIAHAPQASYFMGAAQYPVGGYLAVHETVGNLIDWYAIRFYNQGSTTYDDWTTLVETSNGWATNTAIQQLISGSAGTAIPAHKIVIGKPATPSDAYNTGFVSGADLATILASLTSYRGLGIWQYSSDHASSFEFGNATCGSVLGKPASR